MKNSFRSIFLLITSLLCLSSQAGNILVLSGGTIENAESIPAPTTKVDRSINSVSISYVIDKIGISVVDTLPNCKNFYLNGFGQNSNEGEYAYLQRSDRIFVPVGKDVTLKINKCSYKEFNYGLAPSEPLSYDSNTNAESACPATRDISNILPLTFVSLGRYEYYRSQPIQYVNVYPIQYDTENNIVRIIDELQYTLEFNNSSSKTPFSSNLVIDRNDPIINSSIAGTFLEDLPIYNEDIDFIKDYLIITTSRFKEEVDRFANWKKLMGFNANVVSRNAWTPEETMNSIVKYSKANSNFYYLLIVGDAEDVPPARREEKSDNIENLDNDESNDDSKTYVTDFYYSCLDGDEQPDIYIGRISVSTPEEARVVFDKIISYEKNPPSEEEFYKTGVHASYFQIDHQSRNPITKYTTECKGYIQTSEEVRDIMLELDKNITRIYYAESQAIPSAYKEYENFPTELTKPNFSWEGDSTTVINAINNGAFYVFHRDHGSHDRWVHPFFHKIRISSLTNRLLPVVFNINCSTGSFDKDECFAEKFLRHKGGGCLAIFAATTTSPTPENNYLAKNMFKLISESSRQNRLLNSGYSGSTYTLGEIFAISISDLISENGYSDASVYERKIYHCFGDPSMVFLTEMPYSANDICIKHSDSTIDIACDDPYSKIIVYDNDNGILQAYCQNNLTLTNVDNKNYSISIVSKGMRPVIYENTINRTLFVQNEMIENHRTYDVDKIIVGSSVDNNMPQGSVNFVSGDINLIGKVYILNNVKTYPGVNFKISPKK